MRSLAIVIAVTTVALVACSRAPAAGAGPEASASSATPEHGDKASPAGSGATAPSPGARGGEALAVAGGVSPESCKAACEHRKECGVASDVPGCLRDCTSVSFLFTDDELRSYAKTDCKGVKVGDPVF